MIDVRCRLGNMFQLYLIFTISECGVVIRSVASVCLLSVREINLKACTLIILTKTIQPDAGFTLHPTLVTVQAPRALSTGYFAMLNKVKKSQSRSRSTPNSNRLFIA